MNPTLSTVEGKRLNLYRNPFLLADQITGNLCSYRFDNSNSRTLMESMSIQEKQEFGFDIESIDWKDYIKNIHIPGLRRHVMKGRTGRN